MVDFYRIGWQVGEAIAFGEPFTPIDFKAAKKKKSCNKGYPCKGACISARYNCRNTLEGQSKSFGDYIKNNLGKLTKDQKRSAKSVGINPTTGKQSKLSRTDKDKIKSQVINDKSIKERGLKRSDPNYREEYENYAKDRLYSRSKIAKERTENFMLKHGAPPPPEAQLAVLFSYTSNRFQAMNTVLRYGEDAIKVPARQASKKHVTRDESYQQEIRMAAEALVNAPQSAKFQGEVYRGAALPRKVADSYKVGETLVEPAFVSTTKNKVVAEGFGSKPGEDWTRVTYKIKSRTGVDVSDLAIAEGEKEVLFPPGTKFKVNGITKSDKGVEMEIEEMANQTERNQTIKSLDQGKYKAPYKDAPPPQFAEASQSLIEKMKFPIGRPG